MSDNDIILDNSIENNENTENVDDNNNEDNSNSNQVSNTELTNETNNNSNTEENIETTMLGNINATQLEKVDDKLEDISLNNISNINDNNNSLVVLDSDDKVNSNKNDETLFSINPNEDRPKIISNNYSKEKITEEKKDIFKDEEEDTNVSIDNISLEEKNETRLKTTGFLTSPTNTTTSNNSSSVVNNHSHNHNHDHCSHNHENNNDNEGLLSNNIDNENQITSFYSALSVLKPDFIMLFNSNDEFFYLNLFTLTWFITVLFELLFGLYYNQLDIISDSFFNLFKSLGFIITSVSILLTKSNSFLNKLNIEFIKNRLELISALSNCIFLVIVAMYMALQGIEMTFENDETHEDQTHLNQDTKLLYFYSNFFVFKIVQDVISLICFSDYIIHHFYTIKIQLRRHLKKWVSYDEISVYELSKCRENIQNFKCLLS